jgi:hypothetical protein
MLVRRSGGLRLVGQMRSVRLFSEDGKNNAPKPFRGVTRSPYKKQFDAAEKEDKFVDAAVQEQKEGV